MMMGIGFELRNPTGLAAPAAHYSHVAIVEAGQRLVILSGQVGTSEDGSVPFELDAEAEAMWANVELALTGAGASLDAIVKVTMYVVAGTSAGPASKAREGLLGSHRPTSTLLYVSGLARPEYHYEVEVIAAMPPEKGA